eukprot:136720-Pelagomonas_calceolata.AAC.8
MVRLFPPPPQIMMVEDDNAKPYFLGGVGCMFLLSCFSALVCARVLLAMVEQKTIENCIGSGTMPMLKERGCICFKCCDAFIRLSDKV